MATAPRRLAFAIVRDIEHGPPLAERLAAPAVEALPPNDRAFLHELTLGVLRRRGALDHALAALVDRPFAELSPDVLAVLRLGAYQTLHLRVPAHAAVSESVTLAKEVRPQASGFVNAVLRRLVREGPPPEPDPQTDPRAWLTTAGSLPAWLAERWLVSLGAADAVARARVLLEQPPTYFRLNPRHTATAEARLKAAGIEARPADAPEAWRLVSGRLTDLAREGLVYVQDQWSQLVARLALTEGRILDACAAPGGKSLLLADAVRTGRVVAAEVSPRRLSTLASLRGVWGARTLDVLQADASRPPFRPVFDAVLLDAPCSGLGTLARHPDIRWRLKESDLLRQASRQGELLAALAPLVKPGGRLVYATCSLEPEENEGVVAPFLASASGFDAATLPDWARPYAAGPFLRTRPEAHAGDGFFAASLVRSRANGG